jgi:histidinol-phosphate aminotransferase
MGLAVRAFVAPDARALATAGTYPTFHYHVQGYGGVLDTVAYRDDGRLDLDALLARAKQIRPAIVYVANPDNPSGTFVPRAEMARFVESLPDDVLVFLDEAYADFVEPADLPPDEIDPRTIRTRTFSKAYGMAGARIGYALASSDVIATFQKLRLHFGVNRTAQIGALAALDDEAFMRGVIAEVARGRDEYHALAARHGLPSLPSATNFVCIGIGAKHDAEAMVAALLERGVFVRKPWAPPIDGFIRVTVGTAAERGAFAERFAEALDRVREKAAR